MPLMVMFVCVGRLDLDAVRRLRRGSDARTPAASWSFFPFISARYPTPTSSSLLRVSLGDTVDHVLHERPPQTVQRTLFLCVGGTGDCDLVVLDLDGDVGMHLGRQLALRAGDLHVLVVSLDLDPCGDGDRFSVQLVTRSSPSLTRFRTVLRRPPLPGAPRLSVISPFGVEMMAMPSPPSTRGSCIGAAYFRRPGVLMRFSPLMTGCLVVVLQLNPQDTLRRLP